MAYQHIITEFKEGLGTLTFNRPPVNVLNIAMGGEQIEPKQMFGVAIGSEG